MFGPTPAQGGAYQFWLWLRPFANSSAVIVHVLAPAPTKKDGSKYLRLRYPARYITISVGDHLTIYRHPPKWGFYDTHV